MLLLMAMAHKIKIRKVGNSLGVLLPKDLLEDMKVEEGAELSIEKIDGVYHVTPVDPHFERLMAVYQDVVSRYRNTLRELAK